MQWFWEVVRGYDKKDLAILLQFATGWYVHLQSHCMADCCMYVCMHIHCMIFSSRVPLGGFVNLVGATGLTKFTISSVVYSPYKLPTASTWSAALYYIYMHKDTLEESTLIKYTHVCL